MPGLLFNWCIVSDFNFKALVIKFMLFPSSFIYSNQRSFIINPFSSDNIGFMIEQKTTTFFHILNGHTPPVTVAGCG